MHAYAARSPPCTPTPPTRRGARLRRPLVAVRVYVYEGGVCVYVYEGGVHVYVYEGRVRVYVAAGVSEPMPAARRHNNLASRAPGMHGGRTGGQSSPTA